MVAIEEFDILTSAGHTLGVTKFSSEKSIEKSLVISSATGVLQGYYSKFATYFAEQGYVCFTFDYHGIGKSGSNTKSLKQNTSNLIDWASDQSELIQLAKKTNPENSIILITHSIGGQLLPFNKNHNLIDKTVTIASQSGYWKHWMGFERFKMFTFWYLMIPFLTPLFNYFPAKKMGLFENLPKQMAYQWCRWGKYPDYMLGEFKKEDTFFDKINSPLLSLSFPRDEYATKSSVDWLAYNFTNAVIDRRDIISEDYNIPNVGHFGFFKSKFKDSLWKMTQDWIEEN